MAPLVLRQGGQGDPVDEGPRPDLEAAAQLCPHRPSDGLCRRGGLCRPGAGLAGGRGGGLDTICGGGRSDDVANGCLLALRHDGIALRRARLLRGRAGAPAEHAARRRAAKCQQGHLVDAQECADEPYSYTDDPAAEQKVQGLLRFPLPARRLPRRCLALGRRRRHRGPDAQQGLCLPELPEDEGRGEVQAGLRRQAPGRLLRHAGATGGRGSAARGGGGGGGGGGRHGLQGRGGQVAGPREVHTAPADERRKRRVPG
mmetsp:Transcript_86114/g.219429  ORF Transcript_86114/g.219429 Transcript_86114/m.219429 type:complete len:258 (+) Transcript_86114:486-1259(+)